MTATKEWRYVWHGSAPEQGSNVVTHVGDRLHMGAPKEVEQLIAAHNDQVADLQRQLAEVTRERDTLKAMVDLHDALNDRRRAQANETPFKRRTYENG